MTVAILNAFTKKVADLPDTPSANMTPLELKQQFDAAPEELRTKLNELITEHNAHLVDLATGTWTPVLKGATTAGANTYTKQDGSYTKIGKMVIARFDIRLSAKDGAMSGGLLISGLPFDAINASFGVSFTRFGTATLPAGYTQLTGDINNSAIVLYKNGNGVNWDSVFPSEISSNLLIAGSAIYYTN